MLPRLAMSETNAIDIVTIYIRVRSKAECIKRFIMMTFDLATHTRIIKGV